MTHAAHHHHHPPPPNSTSTEGAEEEAPTGQTKFGKKRPEMEFHKNSCHGEKRHSGATLFVAEWFSWREVAVFTRVSKSTTRLHSPKWPYDKSRRSGPTLSPWLKFYEIHHQRKILDAVPPPLPPQKNLLTEGKKWCTKLKKATCRIFTRLRSRAY